MIVIDWLTMPSMLPGLLPPALLEISTAITTSAPRSRAASTGTGLTTPPSTYRAAPICVGSNTPGMLLDADILGERRRLIEWVFEPLYSLKGRVGDG